MSKSQKELLEVVAALKEVALTGKQVLKDGQINIADLGYLIAMLQKQSIFLEAINGLGKVDIKDLGVDGAMEIVQSLAAAFAEVQAA